MCVKNKIKTNLTSDAALRLKAVIDTAIDGIVTIDEKGIVETINPAAAKLFGFAEKEVVGKSVNMLMPAPHSHKHDGYIKRYIETKKPHIIGIGREVEGKRKDGTLFPLRLAVSEVFLGEKRIFTGIIHDLTDVKKAEEKILKLNLALEAQNEELELKVSERTDKLVEVVNQLLKTNKQLEKEVDERKTAEHALRKSEKELKELLEKEKELNELKSRFVSMASHEFRTPLSTILSSIELVEAYQKTEQQPKRQKHVARIKNAVNNLTSVLNDFLSLSRLEEGFVKPQQEAFLFKPFCEDVVDEFREQLKPGQVLEYEGNGDGRKVFFDKNFLRPVFFNLLSNATKYTPPGKRIHCRVRFEEDLLKITIKDEGIGIPKADQKHLFTRFFRAHNVENIKGTGLGLHIVRRYVELMGGHIRFESEEGKGTSFFVEIPLKNEN
ncbi:MAG TPA: PAS domain S-box protein [Bacteroidetes bacterium]|nr:PAS domain S-box protein [Bacteroidota bacterium]